MLNEIVATELKRITHTLASEVDLHVVLQMIVDAVRELTQADYAALGMGSEPTKWTGLVFSGLSDVAVAMIARHPSGRGLLAAPFTRGEAVNVFPVSADKRTVGIPDGHPQISSFLGVPIFVDDVSLGTLFVANKAGGSGFSQADEAVTDLLASYAAIALNDDRLREAERKQRIDLEQRNRQLAALSEATIAISSELSLEKVLQQIVDAARELIGARYAALGVPNADGYLDAFIHSGMSEAEVAQIPHYPRGLGLLGATAQSDRPIRLENMRKDSRSSGFPANHPPMTRFLGTPILAGDQKIGNLYFTDKIDGTVFTETDEELVVMFAAHASVAVQNAKLYEQVEQLAVLDERTRIGMDLHDGIIQSIYAMGLVLESTKLVMPEGSDEARRLLDMAVDGLNDSIKDIRNFIMDLRPRRFRGDLGQGLAQLVREFQANTLTPVELNLNSAELSNLPTAIGRAVFLTTQEALANIARHAKADLVMVELLRSGGNLIYTIRDDGRGFDVSDKSRQVGHGLANMQARAEELNGRFAISSAPGDGTSITLRLPLPPQTARSRLKSDNDL